MVDAFQDELQKIATGGDAAKGALKGRLAKALPVAAAGVVGYEGLRRANEDRRNGRMMRLQQNGGGLF
jgi:hypothetical protein